MLRNNFIIAFRSLRKNRVFSVINVLGLSAGLTACMLIALYVRFELSYDDFHADAENIFRVATTVTLENETITRESNTYEGIVQALEDKYPDVQSLTVISAFDSEATFLRIRNSNHDVTPLADYKGLYADDAFFNVFSFPLLHGDKVHVLEAPYSAVISETLAQKYFNDDAIGKILEFKDDDKPAKQLTVTGVMKDVPPNSHVKFDVIVSLPEEGADFWEWRGHAYLKLRDHANVKHIENRLNTLARQNNGLKTDDDYGQVSTFALQPLRGIHLYSQLDYEFEPGGNIMLVYALIIFAILILVIGWINYINMSTAIYFQKIRQVAIRKIVGASKQALALQLLTESALLNVAAFVVATFFSWKLLATFSGLVGINENLLDFSDPALWVGTLIFLCISIVVSGLYPALALVSANPIGAMKGMIIKSGSNALIGKALLTFQFVIATILIIVTIATYRQLTFMKSHELGINIDQVLVVRAQNFDQETWSDSSGGYVVDPAYQQRALAFSDELRNLRDVVNTASLSHLPGQLPDWGTEFKAEGPDPSRAHNLKAIGVDYDFTATLGVKLLAGRNFSRDYPSDRGNEGKRAVLINETASKLLGFREPQEAVSRHISTYWGADYEIIGVVRSFHQLSLKEDLTPLYFILQPRALPYFAIDLRTDNLSETIAGIKSIWSRHFPDHPFEYFFLDDYFNRQYHSELRFTTVTGIFTVLGIFIGCMGLFGLTSYAIVQRTKEIAIRKVLGASVKNVIAMFSTGFVKLIVVANCMAIPIACYGISDWLDNYAYRTSLAWWVVLMPVGITLLLALVTIGIQTIKVAVKNPAERLKCE